MPQVAKKILLVDSNDLRRDTHVRMLTGVGYEVECSDSHEASELLRNEAEFDLLILVLHRKKLDEAAAYSERLRHKKPTLPILLLLDVGVFVPRGTLSETMQTGFPAEMMVQIAEKLAGSRHIRELHFPAAVAASAPTRSRPAKGLARQ